MFFPCFIVYHLTTIIIKLLGCIFPKYICHFQFASEHSEFCKNINKMASSNESNETESCIEFEYEKPPNHQKLTFLTKLIIVLAILILLLIFAFWTVHFALQTESTQKSYYSNIFETATDKELCGIEILPGIVRMSRGVDITTLDIFPEPLADDGFKSVLFSFTCTRNRPWRDPRVKNMLYRVPDQVAAINTMSTGNGDIKTQMYSNLRDIKQSLGAKVGVSGSLFGSLLGSFSAGGSYREARDKILGSAESVAEVSAILRNSPKCKSDKHF